MMMYKTRSFYGGSAVTRVHCPINGDFSFSYSSSGREEGGVSLECSSSSSVGDEDEEGRPEATDCPTGYKFDLKFKGCSFPDFGKFHRIVRIINFRFNTFFFPLHSRHELPVPGLVAGRGRPDLHEPPGHQAAAAGRGAEAEI